MKIVSLWPGSEVTEQHPSRRWPGGNGAAWGAVVLRAHWRSRQVAQPCTCGLDHVLLLVLIRVVLLLEEAVE